MYVCRYLLLSHFLQDGSKAVRMNITLDLSLPAAVNFLVSMTFETVREKLTETVRLVKLIICFIIYTVCLIDILQSKL